MGSSAPAGVVPWALTAYPISRGYRTRVEARLGTPLEVCVLSDMRQAGLRAVFARLVRVTRPVGYVLLEDPASATLLPMLRWFLSLTRCGRLGVVGPDAGVTSFGRMAGLGEILHLIGATLRGALNTLLCGVELRRLGRSGRPAPARRRVRRVAYLKTTMWFGLKAGGSVGHVAGVVNALARSCEHVDVVSAGRPPLIDPIVPVHPVGVASPFGYPYEMNYYTFHREFVRQARRVLAQSQPDLLYHRLSLASYAGLQLARDLGVPLVIEYNGSEVWVAQHWGRPLWLPGLAALAEESSLHGAALIVTVSLVLGEELAARGIPRERILVHPNCVDAEAFDPGRFSPESRRALRARYGINASAVVCGFIGTFGAWHGVPVLAETIRELVLRDEAWLRARRVHFLIVGDGTLMARVREILDVPGMARYATLTGLVEQHEAPAHLAAADVLLSPHVPNADGSRFFGSPTKLFEYMAMARGIVASDLDQIGEILRRSYRASALPAGPCPPDEDRLAILATPGSREELTAGLRFLVEHPDYREALGRNARREALARYTWDRNVAAVLERLQDLGGGTA